MLNIQQAFEHISVSTNFPSLPQGIIPTLQRALCPGLGNCHTRLETRTEWDKDSLKPNNLSW